MDLGSSRRSNCGRVLASRLPTFLVVQVQRWRWPSLSVESWGLCPLRLSWRSLRFLGHGSNVPAFELCALYQEGSEGSDFQENLTARNSPPLNLPFVGTAAYHQ